jgi:26S proteasome regulatory subunit N5
MLQLIKRRG